MTTTICDDNERDLLHTFAKLLFAVHTDEGVGLFESPACCYGQTVVVSSSVVAAQPLGLVPAHLANSEASPHELTHHQSITSQYRPFLGETKERLQ
jgi:hypothetical protein